MNGGARFHCVATSAAPRLNAYSPSISHLLEDPTPLRRAAEWTPVYVSLGLIALSVSLGLITAHLQLRYSPDVYVSKKRRETVPEVSDPDWTATEADRFLTRSFFRRLAHLQDFDRVRAGVPDPSRPGSRLHHPGRTEDLRTVGVEPCPIVPHHPSSYSTGASTH